MPAASSPLDRRAGGRSVRSFGQLSRNELFAGLSGLAFVNGLFDRVFDSVQAYGLTAAVMATFEVSVLVWIALFAVPALLLGGARTPVSRLDWLVVGAVLAAVLLPGAPFSWLGLTLLAGYMLLLGRGEATDSPVHRAAWILLALTGTMLWGKLLLMGAGGPVLGADAVLIGWLSGTAQAGNTVQFADGSGYVWIAPGCSSLSNVSLATLCWVLFAQWRGLPWSPRAVGWCLLACLAAIAVNVVRISLLVRYSEHFDLIHGPTGAAIASWISLAAIVGVSAWGGRGMLKHAPASLLLAALLVVSLALKIQHRERQAEQAAYPLAEAKAQVAAFLGAQGFDIVRSAAAPDSPFVPAVRGDCHVVTLAASPLGWDRDILPALARAGDEVFFVVNGARYAQQPVWRTRADFVRGRVGGYLGLPGTPSPVLGVLSSASCADRGVPWLDFPDAARG